MSGLNEYQKRGLLLTFSHIDALLTRALRDADSKQVQSPFSRMALDMPLAQQQAMARQVASLRSRMLAILDRFGVSLPKRDISAVQAMDVAIMMAGVDLDELGSRRLRGYGNVSEETAAEINRLAKELQEFLARMKADLPATSRGRTDSDGP